MLKTIMKCKNIIKLTERIRVLITKAILIKLDKDHYEHELKNFSNKIKMIKI